MRCARAASSRNCAQNAQKCTREFVLFVLQPTEPSPPRAHLSESNSASPTPQATKPAPESLASFRRFSRKVPPPQRIFQRSVHSFAPTRKPPLAPNPLITPTNYYHLDGIGFVPQSPRNPPQTRNSGRPGSSFFQPSPGSHPPPIAAPTIRMHGQMFLAASVTPAESATKGGLRCRGWR